MALLENKNNMTNPYALFKKNKLLFLPLIIIFLILLRFMLLQKPSTDLLYVVKREDLVDSIQVSGVYMTASQIQVNSPTNGIIDELYVSNGDRVGKGDPLFHVESTATEDQKKAAYADYASALGSLQIAKNTKQSLDASMWTKQQSYLSTQNTQNYKNNHNQNPSTKEDYTDLEKKQIDAAVTQSKKDFEASEQAFKNADVAVVAAQAQVEKTLDAYRETQSTTVNAPAQGTVTNLLSTIGDQVNMLSTTTQNTTLTDSSILSIVNLQNPYIEASISEDYAARIRQGQSVGISFDAIANKTFSGRVGIIGTVGDDSQGIVTYKARIHPDTLPLTVKPKMTAIIDVETLRRNSVIDVPNSSIVNKDGKKYVKTKDNKFLEVQVGTTGISKSEITGGLKEGTVIIANLKDK